MKRVLLMVVDGWTSRVFGPALDRGELPTFAELAARGRLDLDCVSIFPSITPAATASIVTGQYPSRHGIAGMSWWDRETGNISYLGDDLWTILQRGMGEFLRGFLVGLNGERLQAPTLFQVVERQRRRAACFNHLIFKGDVAHEVSQPLLLRLFPSTRSTLTVQGPSWLCLGDFVATTGRQHDVDTRGGILNRFGLDDQGTAGFLHDLPDAGALPDFTVAYFPDHDHDSHDRGPSRACETLRHLDGRLAGIFHDWGGLDRVLADTCIVITADHSHSEVSGADGAGIVLDELLRGYRCADPGSGWTGGDDVLLCPNLRSAEVYLRHPDADGVRRLKDRLLEDSRIDQVIWRHTHADRGDEIHVATRDRGALRFRRAPAGAPGVRDEYGGSWDLDGDGAALELTLDGDQVRYGSYPNALERLQNGVDHPRAGRIWATARPGCEFRMGGQGRHPEGGSHGTLHELDSRVPLLVAGAPARDIAGGFTPRIVDVAPMCAAMLGIAFDVPPGAPR